MGYHVPGELITDHYQALMSEEYAATPSPPPPPPQNAQNQSNPL